MQPTCAAHEITLKWPASSTAALVEVRLPVGRVSPSGVVHAGDLVGVEVVAQVPLQVAVTPSAPGGFSWFRPIALTLVAE